MPWNERQDRPRDRDVRTRGTAPANGSDEEFKAALWRATDASLRQDPERWVTASASGGDRRPEDRRESGITAYARDARRDRDTWDHFIDDRGRPDHNYDARRPGGRAGRRAALALTPNRGPRPNRARLVPTSKPTTKRGQLVGDDRTTRGPGDEPLRVLTH